jgi:tetratricopeptide (TPR) repeat protein
MRQMRRSSSIRCAAMLFTLVLVMVFPTTGMCTNPAAPSSAFASAYINLRDSVYQNASIANIRKLYAIADSLRNRPFTEQNNSLYWSARLEYLAGRAENELHNWDEADRHLATGLKAINLHVANNSCDDGWRVKSAIMGQMCLVKIRRMEYWWVLMHGLEVSQLANMALKIQPKNGKAHILIGSTLVYPPLIYGGDPERGIEVMNTALSMPDIEKDDRFNIFSGIGIAYGRLDRKEEALTYLNKALELYPGNRYAGEKFREIASGQHVVP